MESLINVSTYRNKLTPYSTEPSLIIWKAENRVENHGFIHPRERTSVIVTMGNM